MTYHHVTNANPLLSHIHFEEGDASYKVFPALGGTLLEWTYKEEPIIGPMATTKEGLEHLKQLATSALLFPFPNRLANGMFAHGDNTYQLPINEPERNNAIHGFVKDVYFTVVALKNNAITLEYQHLPNAQFPFSFQCTIRYTFNEDQCEVVFVVKNTDKVSFPFGIGWHPYFAIPEMNTASISFKTDKRYITNAEMIPVTTETYTAPKIELNDMQLDTCFSLLESKIELNTSKYHLTIEAPQAHFLQLYIPDDRSSIAIEPMTCIANAFNNGTGKKVLLPHQSFSFTTQLALTLC